MTAQLLVENEISMRSEFRSSSFDRVRIFAAEAFGRVTPLRSLSEDDANKRFKRPPIV